MKTVTTILTSEYSIHEDGWTETLAGLESLIKQIEHLEQSGDSNAAYLTRLAIISSCYLAEQVFNKSVSKYIDHAIDKLGDSGADSVNKRCLENWTTENSIRRIGISRAIRKWPQILTGKRLELGGGTLQYLKNLTDKRNDILHKISDLTHYGRSSEIAKSAVFTAVESCKIIEKHFFPDQDFSYSEWLKKYPVEEANLFGKIKE